MRIWVDADATPKAVKEILFRAVDRKKITTCFVANRGMYLPQSPYLSQVVVEKGFDVADHYIAQRVELGDLVITSDIPLAALVIDAGGVAMSHRGALYTEENVRERLSVRDFMQDLRDSGVQTGGPAPFGEADKRNFANALDRLLTRCLQDEKLRQLEQPR
ncbi:MAG: YaiI/YqxD family protein [Myxococcales bacterium]|nr:YaiI/YqxD family protein [Myxococcales bacterium]MCB9641769.1 YaiI/YqxD family protein [Myxococcales bacterium]